MLLLVTEDTTSLSYWLNWRVLLCAIWVFTPMCVASYLIWKYERPSNSKYDKGTEDESSGILWNEEDAWKPCVKEIPLSLLLIFRVIAFCLLLVALTFDVAFHSADIFYYYTQWTFTLVTIYFAVGSLLSTYGCYRLYMINNDVSNFLGVDAEKGIYMPLTSEEAANGKVVKKSVYKQKPDVPQIVVICSYFYQILFQMTAGAVMLTDSVYWSVIFPFLSIKDYELSFLTVVAHSLNIIMLLGDTALNSLRFPWFRISYFILWTGIYVFFQWTVHACTIIWWPYPFLNLAKPYAPAWYLVVALLHFPCYAIFALIVKFKEYLLSRWFPQSDFCDR